MPGEKPPSLAAHLNTHTVTITYAKKHAEPKPIGGSRFDELDALRGLCACMVTFNHFRWAFSDGWDLPYTRGVQLRFDNCTLIAVYVFFIISGHVIAYRFLQNGSAESLLGAAFRRVPRLVLPVLWANLISWVLASHGAFWI